MRDTDKYYCVSFVFPTAIAEGAPAGPCVRAIRSHLGSHVIRIGSCSFTPDFKLCACARLVRSLATV